MEDCKKDNITEESVQSDESPRIDIPDHYYEKIRKSINTFHNLHIDTTYDDDFDEKARRINNELLKNEDQKRNFRDRLLRLVSKLIYIQLVFFNLVIIIIVVALIFDFSCFRQLNDMSVNLLSFLKYYISATIVELLSMLFFILRYVFIDTKGIKKKLKK